MIARGDKSARDAFRAGLRSDTPIPLPPVSTEELDAIDILEVGDVAEAIARAESTRRLPSAQSGPDIFDVLATPRPIPTPLAPRSTKRLDAVPTDDLSGPALPATLDLIALADDAFYHPGGRVRSLADVTLDGYRPEPTMLVRIRERRTRASWLVVALLLPLTALAVGAILSIAGEADTTRAQPQQSPAATTTTAHVATPAKAEPKKAELKKAEPKPATVDVPSFDVKSLPPARR